MIKFSQEKVLLLHKLITEETGGDPNVRDIAFLNSAHTNADIFCSVTLTEISKPSSVKVRRSTEPLK